MSSTFGSATLFIESTDNLKDQVDKICLIIDALYTLSLSAAANEDIDEYSLNDGQIVIKTSYRGLEGIVKSIKGFETIKQLLLNKLNSRSFALRDAKTITQNHGRRFNTRG